MFGWGLPNYQNSNLQQDDGLRFAESEDFKRSVPREHSPAARAFRQSKCDMAELRQRKSAPDKSKLSSSSTTVEADGRARTRRQRKDDSPLLLLVAPLIVLFHVALVSAPESHASVDRISRLQF